MKWLFSIAFAPALSASSIAGEMPDEQKIIDGLNRHLAEIDCKKGGANLTREETFFCIAKEMEEIDRIIREIHRGVRVAEECQSRKLPEPELRECINRGLEGAGQ